MTRLHRGIFVILFNWTSLLAMSEYTNYYYSYDGYATDLCINSLSRMSNLNAFAVANAATTTVYL